MWCDLGDELGDLLLELLDRACELADLAKLAAGAADPGALLGAGQAPADQLAPLLGEQSAAGEGLLGPVLGRTRLGSVTVRPRRSFAGLRF